MATMTFGQLDSWDSDSSSKRAGKDDFFNIRKDGSYTVRFAEKPFEFDAHWVEPIPGGKKLKVNCAGRDCSLCKGGVIAGIQMAPNKSKHYYVSLVLNREAKRFQVFEYTKQIFQQVKRYFVSKAWGDPAHYDIEIVRNVNKKPDVYQCVPQPKEPLTTEEKAALEELKGRIDLAKHAAAMDNEGIERRISEFVQRSTLPGMAPVAVVAAAAAPVVAGETVDTDFEF